METARLTSQTRQQLRAQIDQAVRARTTTPTAYACAECGADIRTLSSPVNGCRTCSNRFGRRRLRANN
jgi:hypothetical protein